MEKLFASYEKRREAIKKRLEELRQKKADKEIFKELAFCLCVPQSKAKLCWAAIEKMDASGVLSKGTIAQMASQMRGLVRFHKTKARRIYEARKKFTVAGQFAIKEKLSGDPRQIREWLVENVNGFGYKLAGQFLRNIGVCQTLAILDIHVLKNLQRYGVINEKPKSLTRKRYMEIEVAMEQFSKRIGIPMEELDLLFWSEQTGEIFK